MTDPKKEPRQPPFTYEGVMEKLRLDVERDPDAKVADVIARWEADAAAWDEWKSHRTWQDELDDWKRRWA